MRWSREINRKGELKGHFSEHKNSAKTLLGTIKPNRERERKAEYDERLEVKPTVGFRLQGTSLANADLKGHMIPKIQVYWNMTMKLKPNPDLTSHTH